LLGSIDNPLNEENFGSLFRGRLDGNGRRSDPAGGGRHHEGWEPPAGRNRHGSLADLAGGITGREPWDGRGSLRWSPLLPSTSGPWG